MSGKEVQQEERYTDEPYHFQTGAESFFDARKFSGSKILGSIVGNTVSQCGKGGDHQVVQLDRSRISGNDTGTEAIYDTLKDNVSDGDKTLL